MTTSAIQNFSKASVKARMLRRAVQLWGYPEAEMEAFDPLVNLLMEACAVEIEKIAHETENIQFRAIEQLAKVMNPGIDVAKPAYGILQVQAVEPVATLTPEAQFVFKSAKSSSQQGAKANPAEVFFSPVRPSVIYNGAIRILADPTAVYSVENGYRKEMMAQAVKAPAGGDMFIWLGIQLESKIESLAGMSFFFSWPNEPDKEVYCQYLPLSKWYGGDGEIQTVAGLPDRPSGTETMTTQPDDLQQITDHIRQLYSRYYMSVSAEYSSLTANLPKQAYPPEFGSYYSQKHLSALREPLIWLRVQFPQAMPMDAITALHCSINSFPVINRRLHQLTYRLQPGVNIIPLESDDSFLAVKEVCYSAFQQMNFAPFSSLSALSSNDYTLQYDVGRFDQRKAREWLGYMLELVRDESMAFSALGEEFLSSTLRELNQSLARLEQKVQQKSARHSVPPCLVIKPAKAGDNVYIEYWSTTGEAANKIPASSRLLPYQCSEVQKNEIYLLTSTMGGREKLNANEKLKAYKRSLLTRDRVVTQEDIRAVCLAELGDKAERIEVSKGFVVGITPETGFTRCIRVGVLPAKNGGSESVDWDTTRKELQLLLEMRATTHFPIQVEILSR